jgi:hypothetical protein
VTLLLPTTISVGFFSLSHPFFLRRETSMAAIRWADHSPMNNHHSRFASCCVPLPALLYRSAPPFAHTVSRTAMFFYPQLGRQTRTQVLSLTISAATTCRSGSDDGYLSKPQKKAPSAPPTAKTIHTAPKTHLRNCAAARQRGAITARASAR